MDAVGVTINNPINQVFTVRERAKESKRKGKGRGQSDVSVRLIRPIKAGTHDHRN